MKKETKLSISQVFVYLVLLFVFVFFSVLTKTFLSTKNLLNICRQVSMTGICAVGMTMVLLTGGIDISIGSIIALSGVVSAKLINDLGFGIFPAMVVGVLVGIVCGLISGIMVAHFEVPALIATLAMQTIARGFAFIMTQGIPVYGLPESIKRWGRAISSGFRFQSIFWHWFFSLAGGCWSRQALAVIFTQSAAMRKSQDFPASMCL